MNKNTDYQSFMQEAIYLALKARWQTLPNPSVGALLVRNNEVVAQGWHKGAGKAHAEIEVINFAKENNIPLEECTLVCTLEPCHHEGKTPPCTKAILEAGIKKVVIGAMDPNSDAAGGAVFLKENGVEVITGVEEQDCLDLIDDFVTWQSTELPYTIIKLASTIDGRIATRTGNSKWVSSEESRQTVHVIRRHMHAVIVGGNTFYHDDPQLTCRLFGVDPEHQPLAVVVTSRLPDANSQYHLIKERPESTVFWTTVASAASPKAEALRKIGVTVLGLTSTPGLARGSGMRSQLDLKEGLLHLRKELNCMYVLCEGGGRLALAFLENSFAHELHLHLAPKILGDNEATPLFDGRSPDRIDEDLQLRIVDMQKNSEDLLVTLKPALGGIDPKED